MQPWCLEALQHHCTRSPERDCGSKRGHVSLALSTYTPKYTGMLAIFGNM